MNNVAKRTLEDGGEPKAKSLRLSDESPEAAEEPAMKKSGDLRGRQVFVGGIPKEAMEDVIKEYFSKFGTVEDVDWRLEGCNHNWGSRGFCILKFSSIEEAEFCLSKYDEHSILDKWVEVKWVDYGKGKGKGKGKENGKGFGKGSDEGKGKGCAPQRGGPPSTPAGRAVPYSAPIAAGFGARHGERSARPCGAAS